MTVVVKVKKMWHDLKEDKVRFADEVFEMSDDRFAEVNEKLPDFNEKIESSSDTEEKPKGKRKAKVVKDDGKEE